MNAIIKHILMRRRTRYFLSEVRRSSCRPNGRSPSPLTAATGATGLIAFKSPRTGSCEVMSPAESPFLRRVINFSRLEETAARRRPRAGL